MLFGEDIIVVCLDCQQKSLYDPRVAKCPYCGNSWREAIYDYTKLGNSLAGKLSKRPFNLWRYKELLPVHQPNPAFSLGEGGTPLIHASNLGMMLGCPYLYIKDERQNPTSSFKDRQAAVTISALKEAGITEMVVASTGNVAISYSAYAARAGIKLWAFLTSLVPEVKMHEVAIYGTQVVKVTGSYDQVKQVAEQFALQRNLYLDQGSRTIPSVEAMKTIAFEIAEQLAVNPTTPETELCNHKPAPTFQIPDWYLQSVSGGMGPLGVIKGFDELMKLGCTKQMPKIGIIQVEGCSPMVQAWRQGKEKADPVLTPRTHITTLATGDPGRTYTLINQKINSHGGTFDSVTDEEAFRAIHVLAKMEGFSVEPAAAVAFAGLVKLVRNGTIKPTETVVINCTGHSMPIEETVLGEGWSHDIVLPSQYPREAPEEGLLAALSRVTADRYTRVAIIDDNSDVRRLIRRILQSQGNYTLYEAKDGREAVNMVREQLPDLIILDLMMPELDGFAVLDELQAKAETADIPVIVVTAKELTLEEKNRLKGHINSLMQKGDFLSDEFIDEVRSLTN
jgi:threonine synthase